MPKSKAVPKPFMRLALQWMRDEISTSQVQKHLGVKQSSQAIYRLGIALRAAQREGLVK